MSGKIITIAQQKGGSGKTTIAAHLAVALMRRGDYPVAILDVDPQGSLGSWFETREETLGENGTGLSFRTSSGWGARREARNLARDHGIVIVDTPPKTDSDVKPAIEIADLVLVPIQPTPVDLWATDRTLDIADRERTPALLVFNRVPPRAALTQEMLAAITESSFPLADARVGNRTAYAASMGKGKTVIETEPSGKASAETAALAEEILARLLSD
ncbi:ParA family protein [Rhizobiales bacterium]|uniref:ParA family partition ATPase n=1 Tax=Hongsoonwoonella zoysiae TaxID=2821844 RepID=UPI001561006B|nr:ParA family partition ATPase [Hongsoonwoonella zoysiae]NRG18451.1 ParA family protein [Hongsoonwoonella zoysiae]